MLKFDDSKVVNNSNSRDNKTIKYLSIFQKLKNTKSEIFISTNIKATRKLI